MINFHDNFRTRTGSGSAELTKSYFHLVASLDENSHTLIVACASPDDSNICSSACYYLIPHNFLLILVISSELDLTFVMLMFI
jgi:hypothetical protein